MLNKLLIPYDLNYKMAKGRVQKKKKYGIFHTLVGWVGLKKSFSIKNGQKLPKIT